MCLPICFARRITLVFLGFSASLISLGSLSADEPLRLVLQGGEHQNCIVHVRYFRARKLTKSLATRVALAGGVAEEPIESRHDGVQILVQAAATPLTARLMKGQEEIAQKTLEAAGAIQLTAGRIGAASFEPPSIELSDAEAKLIRSLVQAMEGESSTIDLVSPAADAEIDWPSLDVLLRELRTLIGLPQTDQDVSDGWIGWKESSGLRSIGGVLRGKDGVCGLKLTLADGLLVNVIPNCELLTDDYFCQPLDHGPYEKKAQQIIRRLFEGQAAQAHQLYSPRFQGEVSVEQLTELSDLIRERYGKEIREMRFKTADLRPYNYLDQNQLLLVDHVVSLSSGDQCRSRVTFSIPSSRNQVGRAHLGAVNFFPIFTSSYPELAETAKQLIVGLPQTMQAQELRQKLPQLLQPATNQGELQAVIQRVQAYLGGREPQVDFDLWNVLEVEDWLLASGPASIGNETGLIEVHFLKDGGLLGFSIYGPAFAESTLGCFNFDPIIEKTAQRFWGYLLREDARAAHGMLAPEFREQFPLADLKSQLEAGSDQNPSVKGLKVDAVRLTEHVDRPRPIMATVFLTATLEDDSTQSMACELAWPLADEPTGTKLVYDFSNDFEFDFPVSLVPVAGTNEDGARLALSAFYTPDPRAVVELVQPSKRGGIDMAALTAYLKHFQEIAGEWQDPTSTSRVAEYSAGIRRIRCNSLINGQDGQPFSIEIWFRDGYLERFNVAHPGMLEFVERVSDTAESERRIRGFIQSWFTKLPQAQIYLASSVRNETMLKTLESVRNEFVQEHGKLSSVSVSKTSTNKGVGTQDFSVTLKGVRSPKTMRFSLEFGAFGGLISGIDF
jgi:hypothetical protein